MSVLTDFTGIVRERFIETGTQEGNSLMHAYPHFKECFSVELDRTLYEAAKTKFRFIPNVWLSYSSSPKFLREAIDHRVPTTFWLDAHWDGKPLPGNFKQCPLLEELYEIERINWRVPPIILIDDARLFTKEDFRKHPGRWKEEEWPTIAEIDAALPGYKMAIVGTEVDPILRYTRDDFSLNTWPART